MSHAENWLIDVNEFYQYWRFKFCETFEFNIIEFKFSRCINGIRSFPENEHCPDKSHNYITKKEPETVYSQKSWNLYSQCEAGPSLPFLSAWKRQHSVQGAIKQVLILVLSQESLASHITAIVLRPLSSLPAIMYQTLISFCSVQLRRRHF